MKLPIASAALVMLLSPPALAATGNLELPDSSPAASTTAETGIGQIAGWHCTAKTIEIQIDDYPRMKAASGTDRLDTAGVCGRADTGFGLTYNYNILAPGFHRVRAFADGVLFAERGFSTVGVGAEFLTGAGGGCVAFGFPSPGQLASVLWSEAKQNFTLQSVLPEPAMPVFNMQGSYTGFARLGAVTDFNCFEQAPLTSREFAEGSANVQVRTDTTARTMTIDLAFAGGRSCHLTGKYVTTPVGWTLADAQGLGGCLDLGELVQQNITLTYAQPVQGSPGSDTFITLRVNARDAVSGGQTSCGHAQWLSVLVAKAP